MNTGERATTKDGSKPQPPRLSTAHSRELGEELRLARRRANLGAGMGAAEIAKTLNWSLGKLSKLETGNRGTSLQDIATLMGLLAADRATRDRVMAIAAEPDNGSFLRLHEQCPDSLLAAVMHEKIARTITVYDPFTVPSLVQTEDYALELTGDPEVTAARMARQAQLRPSPRRRMVVYVHEAALRMVVGSPKVMRDQLLHLVLMGGWHNTTVRVIRISSGLRTPLQYPGTLLTFDEPCKPLAYAETGSATVFHDAPDAVSIYENQMRYLDTVALNPEESRKKLSSWTGLYDHKAA